MSNRLEHEFPTTRWQAPAPGVPGGLSDPVIQRYLAEARRARSQAFRDAGRSVVAVAARMFGLVAAFVRCGAYGIAKQPPAAGDCGGAATRSA